MAILRCDERDDVDMKIIQEKRKHKKYDNEQKTKIYARVLAFRH